MTIQQLQYALALQQAKSYSKAAKILGISQPGLSLQIKKLEEGLGLIIFDRSRKSVEETEAGKVFLNRVQRLLNEFSQVEHLAKSLSENFKGELNIGIIPTLAPYLLPLFINQFNQKYSQLKVHIKEALTEEIIENVKSGELDGGIISTPIMSTVEFSFIPLFYEGFKLFVSPDHALYQSESINVRDIPLKDIWLLKEGNCFRDQVNNICEISKAIGSQNLFYFESNSIESLCRIVEFKGGITFLPELTTLHLNEDREDMIKELTGKKKVREISMIYIPNHSRKEDLYDFSNVVKANLPKNLLTKGEAERVPTNVKV